MYVRILRRAFTTLCPFYRLQQWCLEDFPEIERRRERGGGGAQCSKISELRMGGGPLHLIFNALDWTLRHPHSINPTSLAKATPRTFVFLEWRILLRNKIFRTVQSEPGRNSTPDFEISQELPWCKSNAKVKSEVVLKKKCIPHFLKKVGTTKIIG